MSNDLLMFAIISGVLIGIGICSISSAVVNIIERGVLLQREKQKTLEMKKVLLEIQKIARGESNDETINEG